MKCSKTYLSLHQQKKKDKRSNAKPVKQIRQILNFLKENFKPREVYSRFCTLKKRKKRNNKWTHIPLKEKNTPVVTPEVKTAKGRQYKVISPMNWQSKSQAKLCKLNLVNNSSAKMSWLINLVWPGTQDETLQVWLPTSRGRRGQRYNHTTRDHLRKSSVSS